MDRSDICKEQFDLKLWNWDGGIVSLTWKMGISPTEKQDLCKEKSLSAIK